MRLKARMLHSKCRRPMNYFIVNFENFFVMQIFRFFALKKNSVKELTRFIGSVVAIKNEH